MIKSNYKKLIPKSVGNLSVLKALKGEKLLWKKITFKKIQGYTWDKARFNGNSKDKLPLDTKLRIKIWNGSYKLLFGGRVVDAYRTTFILRKNKELIIESASGGKVEYSIEENENEAIENCYILE